MKPIIAFAAPTAMTWRTAPLTITPPIIPGPITDAFAKVQEVPPMVMKKTNHSEQSPISSKFDLASITPKAPFSVMRASKNNEPQASSAQAIKLKSAPLINFSKIKGGDIIFRVATDKSKLLNQIIVAGQESQVKKFAHNQDKLPVLAQNVVHCDVAIGKKRVAETGGPNDCGEWAALGSNTQSFTMHLRFLKSDTEEYVVMRPKNEKVAARMAQTAQAIADKPITFNVKGLLQNGLLHDRGDPHIPSLTGNEQGPQGPPLEVPDSMFCSEFVANIITDGEKEALREDRAATTESIDRTQLSPSELIDNLAGSGNFEIFMVDQAWY